MYSCKHDFNPENSKTKMLNGCATKEFFLFFFNLRKKVSMVTKLFDVLPYQKTFRVIKKCLIIV